MRIAGISVSEIATTLDRYPSVIRAWLRPYERQQNGLLDRRPVSDPFFRFMRARNAAEWIAVLNDEISRTPDFVKTQGDKVVLYCGTVHAKSGLFALTTLAEGLEFDPADGKTYAFCGICRKTMLYFRWDGSGFQFTSRLRDYGMYVWPSEKAGKSLVVTHREFEFILYGSQTKNADMP